MEFQLVQNVINRMKKAYDSKKGICISAAELAEMKLTVFGEIWEQDEPRPLSDQSSGREYSCSCSAVKRIGVGKYCPDCDGRNSRR